MANLIVSRHEDILETTEGKQLVWQSGVILSSPRHKARARLEVSNTKNRVRLRVKGEEARDYLSVLRDKINQLLKLRKGLNFTESVGLPISAYHERNVQHNDDSTVKLEFAPYERLNAEEGLQHEVTCSDSGAVYYLEKVMGFIMAKDKQGKSNTTIVHGNATFGSNSPLIMGDINITTEQKHDVSSMRESLDILSKLVLKHEVDAEQNAIAYAELQQIRKYLGDLETAGPEVRGKLIQALDSIKDGSLGGIKLGNDIKDATETIDFLQSSAATVSTWLSGFGI